MSITKTIPSGSTDGKPVKIAQTATAGTLFHTADASAKDEIWMWVTNTDTVDRKVTVEFGGATAPDWNIVMTIPTGDVALVIPGVPLTNSTTCKAFAAAANVLNMFGYINRIS